MSPICDANEELVVGFLPTQELSTFNWNTLKILEKYSMNKFYLNEIQADKSWFNMLTT